MGEQICSAFGEIEDEIIELDWYLFPMKAQKILLIFLINAQQPVEFMGFGNFPASRENMQKVNKIQIIGCSHKFQIIDIFSDCQNGIFVFSDFSQISLKKFA